MKPKCLTLHGKTAVLFVSVLMLSLSACSSSPSPSPTSSLTQRQSANSWVKLDAGAFSLYAPSGWEFRKQRGIDSYVGEFVGDHIVLEFDYGWYSNPFDDALEPKYAIARENVGGQQAKIIYPSKADQGVTGIYFAGVPDSNKLSLWGRNLTESQRELALKIFRTVRFPLGHLPSTLLK